MSIPVFKPQYVRWLHKPITLWAVWEGTDGNHHERVCTYTDPMETVGYFGSMPMQVYWRPGDHPLLTSDYQEDPVQVLPGTLRFIRIEDVAKIHRIIDPNGYAYAFLPAHNQPWGAGPTITLLNGYKMRFNQYQHNIILPSKGNSDD